MGRSRSALPRRRQAGAGLLPRRRHPPGQRLLVQIEIGAVGDRVEAQGQEVAQLLGAGRLDRGGEAVAVRSVDDARVLFDAGVARIVLGTAAVEDPDLVPAVAAHGAVAVGLDVRGDEVAVRGWTEGSGLLLDDALARYSDLGTAAFVITRIERDGTLEGPDLDGLAGALAATAVDVVASGGVGCPADLEDLAALEAGGRRIAGIILGRALYEGTVDLADEVRRMSGRPDGLAGGARA